VPAIHWADLNELGRWFACFLLGAVETAAIGRTFAATVGDWMPTRISACRAESRRRTGPVSRQRRYVASLVNEGGGARHPCRAIAGIILWWCFSSRTCWPRALARIGGHVLVAVAGLFGFSTPSNLCGDRPELWWRWRHVGVLGQGLLRGDYRRNISLVLLIRRVATARRRA
jgi:hypothetical protein